MKHVVVICLLAIIACNNENNNRRHQGCIDSRMTLKAAIDFVSLDTVEFTFNFFDGRDNNSFRHLHYKVKKEEYEASINNFNELKVDRETEVLLKEYLDAGLYFKSRTKAFTKYYYYSTKLSRPFTAEEKDFIEERNSSSHQDFSYGYFLYRFTNVADFRGFLQEKKTYSVVDTSRLIIAERVALIKPCIR